jgi:hypothetical protein
MKPPKLRLSKQTMRALNVTLLRGVGGAGNRRPTDGTNCQVDTQMGETCQPSKNLNCPPTWNCNTLYCNTNIPGVC